MTKNVTFLIVGADSAIGKALVKKLTRTGESVYRTSRTTGSRPLSLLRLDLEEPAEYFFRNGQIERLAKESRLVVFFCAANTKLIDCENNPERSYLVNVVNTMECVKRFHELSASIIYLSSSAVFSQNICKPNEFTSRTPKTMYGIQKKKVEDLLLELQTGNSDSVIAIARLSKVLYGDHSLVSNWIMSLRAGEKIQAFVDRTLTPISLDFTVSSLITVANSGLSGVLHLSGYSELSYYELSKKLADYLNVDRGLITPIQSGLDSTGFGEVYGGQLGSTNLNKGLSIENEPLDHVIDSLFSDSQRVD